jgi:hypothetical protein
MTRWIIVALGFLGAHACAVSNGVAAGDSGGSSVPGNAASGPAHSVPVSGTCWRLAQTAQPPSLVSSSPECVDRSQATQNELSPLLAQAVQDRDTGLVVHVDFPCISVRAEPARALALVVGGHGGQARVVGISSSGPSTFRVRVLRVLTGGGPNNTPTGPVEYFRSELPGSTVTNLFDQMRTALAARITTERKPSTVSDQIELGAFGISSSNTSLEIELRDSLGHVAERAWQGYGGSVDAENRVPVEFAWRALSEAAVERTAFQDPAPEDRALLRDAWLQHMPEFERPWYSVRALLIFAADAGSVDLLPSIVKQLDSTDTEVQSLAVDALAAITRYDVRHDASGKARPLSNVVAEYRRECSQP